MSHEKTTTGRVYTTGPFDWFEMDVDYNAIVNDGFNAWLASLPDDNWDKEYERAIPVRWEDNQWKDKSQPINMEDVIYESITGLR